MDYRRIFENLPGMFLLLEPDLTIAGASDAYLRVAFATRESLVGKLLFEAFPDNPADPAADGVSILRSSLARVLATGEPDTMPLQKYDVEDANGVWVERYWHPSNTPILDGAANVELIVHRVEDATELVTANKVALGAVADLRASEILESITEGFFSLGRDWRFEYVNPEATRILGRDAVDLVGQTLWEAYPGLENTEFDRGYHRAMGGHGKPPGCRRQECRAARRTRTARATSVS